MFGSISSRDSTSRLDLGTKELAKQEFLECFCSLLCIKEMLYFKSPIKNENANVISTSVSKTVSTEKDVVAELIALAAKNTILYVNAPSKIDSNTLHHLDERTEH